MVSLIGGIKMLKELLATNEKFITKIQEDSNMLGAWYFGSLAHGNSDKYSDIDIVFLITETGFNKAEKNICKLLSQCCDEIILMWEENFNSQAIKNYDFLLSVNDKIFQYDIFLLNSGKIDDFMCQMHYTGLKPEDIVFEKEHFVSGLIHAAPAGSTWNGDYKCIIDTYWLHIHMSKKYFARKDFFKLEGILRILMDSHVSLLLTAYDNLTWGSTANKLYYLDSEKKKHLMKYGCIEDWQEMKKNLETEIQWFCTDVKEICTPEYKKYNNSLSTKIMKLWKN